MSARIRRLALILLLACMAGGASPQTAAPARWNRAPDVFPVLTIQAHPGFASQGYAKSATASLPLLRDVWSEATMAAGARDGGNLCLSSLTMAAPGGQAGVPKGAAAYWNVKAKLVSVDADLVTFDLRWSRVVNDSTLDPLENTSESARISMHEGAPSVLDLVRRRQPPADGCATFAVSLEVGFSGPGELSNAAIAYDVWLIQRDRDTVSTDRFRMSAGQGEQAEYFFRPIYYEADGRRAQAPAAFAVSVRGSIRGRVRSDGLIDLTVDAWWGARHPSGSVGIGGRKLLTVKPGETVEIETRSGEGHLSGVGGLSNVMAGQRSAIRVTARRLW